MSAACPDPLYLMDSRLMARCLVAQSQMRRGSAMFHSAHLLRRPINQRSAADYQMACSGSVGRIRSHAGGSPN